MNWILRNGVCMFLVAFATFVWCLCILPGDIFSLAVSWGLTYIIWTIQCAVYIILGVLRLS